jgi:hypothetical protein
MPGLVPGIHVLRLAIEKKDVDGRDKPGHDDKPSLRANGSARKRRPMAGSAKQSSFTAAKLDCFVASLLAMTVGEASSEELQLLRATAARDNGIFDRQK